MQSDSTSRTDLLMAEFMQKIGRMTWAIPEGYIPGQSHVPAPEMTSHEACCILNASDKDAQVAITDLF